MGDYYHEYLKKRSFLGYIYRKRFLYPKISKYLFGSVLDVGCGIGDFLRFYEDSFGVDINEDNIKYCKNNELNCALMPIDILPFDECVYDCILMDNVVEHILQPEFILNEVSRVLKSNGRLIVGVPGAKGFKYDSDHKVFYDKSGLVKLMRIHGFQMVHCFSTPFAFPFASYLLKQYAFYGVFEKS